MAENTNTANDNPAQNNQNQMPPIVINTQYIKDLSLEIPHAPEIFRKHEEFPKTNL